MTRGRGRSRATCLVGIAAALIAGCSPPDRWARFDTDLLYDDLRPEPALIPPRIPTDPAAEPPAPVAPPELDADGRLILTLEQATLMSLSNNRDLSVQRLNPAIVATFEDVERGFFDPELFASAQFVQEERVEVSRATGESFPTEREDTTFGAGIRQNLPTGTSIELGATTDRATSNRTPEQQGARLGLTVTQSLLRGRGTRVNLASVRQARLDTVASRYELQAFVEAIFAETERTYWLLALAEQQIGIFEESLEVARLQRREVEDRIRIGVLPATERASAEAEVAQREQALIDARAELATLRIRLLRLINPRPDGRLDDPLITASDPRARPEPIADVDERIALALRARPELNEARVRLEQARLETIVTRNGVLPRLDFFVAFGKTGFSDSFGRAFSNIDEDTFDLTAGLELSASLGNRAARALDEAARTGRRRASLAIENLEQLVRVDVRVAATEVDRAAQQVTASAVTRALREEALRAENERFRVGSSTSLLVAQAQRDLLESQIAEVDALVAYRLALIDLYLAEGTLTQRRGLDLAD